MYSFRKIKRNDARILQRNGKSSVNNINEYSKVNVKLTDAQLKKLKTAVKNNVGTTLIMNVKMLNENNLPHELLLARRQKPKLRNAFNNNMSAEITLSKAQVSKIIKSSGFLGSLLSTIAGPLMKVAVLLAQNILARWGITATYSAIDAEIQKKIHGSGTTTLIMSNKKQMTKRKLFKLLKILILCLKELLIKLRTKLKNKKAL